MNRTPLLATPLALALALAGCAAPSSPAPEPPAVQDADGHGKVAGAAQVAEPQPLLVSVDADGGVGLVDLLTGEASQPGRIGAPTAIASDGRYAFATTDAGLEIIDGGRWSWDHGDHFHYYRGEPAFLGTIEGTGPVVVTGAPLATAGGTGAFFSGSGEAVLIDNEALDRGEVLEAFRIDTGTDAGVVAPVDDGAIVATPEHAAVYDASGTEVESLDCPEPAGAVTTRVGTVVGCADGVMLASGRIDSLDIEKVAYPGDAPERATAFAGRKNRPTVAGLSDPHGFWLLDTRERNWSHVEVEAELVEVVASDDEGGRVVALDADGRVLVYDESGALLGESEPLVEESLDGGGIALIVDAQRAYLSDPTGGVVHEIDYADGARVARTLETPTTPLFATELGR